MNGSSIFHESHAQLLSIHDNPTHVVTERYFVVVMAGIVLGAVVMLVSAIQRVRF